MRAIAFCAGPAALLGIPPPVPRAALPPAAVWLVLAQRAVAAGEPADAMRCFDAALAHDPRLAVAHLGRAFCLSELGRDAEAQDALAAVLEAALGQEDVLLSLARMCAREGETSFAMPLLLEAVRAKPALGDVVAADPLFADHPVYLAAVGRL